MKTDIPIYKANISRYTEENLRGSKDLLERKDMKPISFQNYLDDRSIAGFYKSLIDFERDINAPLKLSYLNRNIGDTVDTNILSKNNIDRLIVEDLESLIEELKIPTVSGKKKIRSKQI